jgi:CheY-like chemotaxis protein
MLKYSGYTDESFDCDDQADAIDTAYRKPRLLAVDDAPDSAELISRIAERCGYEARFVADSSMVPSLVEEWQPDVVATDICMPKMDAIELFGVLAHCNFSGNLILISGQDDQLRRQARQLAEIRQLNVIGDLPKPVPLQTLKKVLAH